MKSEALKNNALAFGVSGSGPSIFAIAEGAENAKKIEIALKKVYKNVDLSSQTFISALTKDSGTRILN
jgi:homoserine kinase